MVMLVVDDEDGARTNLIRAIRGAAPDSIIHAFSSPEEALAFSKDNIIEVAFLDIHMPEMTGIDLAKRLKRIYPNLNIIFASGFGEYAVDAFKLRTSGYLLKPVLKSDVQAELLNLRYPVSGSPEKSRIYAKTFGNFDLYVNGKLLPFRREKVKEALAFLIDKSGSAVTRKEIAAAIFESDDYSRATQAYLTQILKKLSQVLIDAGIGDMLVFDYNTYAVDPSKFDCDAYDYLEGDARALNSFHGEYMMQYSWSEYSIGKFYE